MKESSIRSRLNAIEEQIKVLKAEMEAKPPRKAKRRFGELYGIWKGKSQFTYEEIKEAEIKLKDELDGSRS